MSIEIFTDASLIGEPADCNGGYGYTINGKEFGEYVEASDVNLLELIAVIRALGRILPTNEVVYVYSDSAYVVSNINYAQYEIWQENNWKRSDGKPIANIEEWKLLIYYLENWNIHMRKVPAHSGIHLNEICDKVAKKAASTYLSPKQTTKRYKKNVRKKYYRR